MDPQAVKNLKQFVWELIMMLQREPFEKAQKSNYISKLGSSPTQHS